MLRRSEAQPRWRGKIEKRGKTLKPRPKLTLKRCIVGLGILVGLLILVMGLSIRFGLPVIDPWRVIVAPGAAGTDPDILWRVRLPRILAGAIVGGSLGGCGAVLQALLRNPLAYPHILGISGGAAVGGIGAQLLGISTVTLAGLTLPGGILAAFATALAGTFCVYRLACVRGRLEPVTLILVGVVFNSFAAAMILFFFSLADMRESRSILFWMVGSLDLIDLRLLGWAAAIAISGLLYLMSLARALDVLTLGDDVAAGLGVPVQRVRRGAFFGTSLVVGAVVSLCGMIGFVGLIVPHTLRLVLGSDHRQLIPASVLGGAIFLVVTDYLSRTLLYPIQLPVGVLTAFCGGPFFIYLLKRHRRRTLGHGWK